MEKELMLAYLAGLIDGDGNIALWRSRAKTATKGQKYQTRIIVLNTNECIMHLLQEHLGGSCTKVVYEKKECAPVFKWRVYGSNCHAVVEKLLPYLIINKKRAEIVRKYSLTIGKQKAAIPEHIVAIRDDLFEQHEKELDKVNIYRKGGKRSHKYM